MKITNNPDTQGMTCTLPNGVTVEVEVISMEGSSSNHDEQNIENVRSVLDALPESMTHASSII